MLHSILQQPFFDELRTKRQLGYSVQLQQLTEGGFSYLALWVDGSHPPEVLNEAMENFISGCTSHIENLPEEVLDEHKRGLVNLFLETFKTMGEESSYLYTGIEDQRQGFDLYVKDAARVGSLTKKVGTISRNAGTSSDYFEQDLLSLLSSSISASGTDRAKLSLQVRAPRLLASYDCEPLRLAVQRAGAGDSEGLAELLEGGPTGAELLDMLGLPKDGGAVFDAVQALLYGPKLSGKLEVGDLPSLRANLTVRSAGLPVAEHLSNCQYLVQPRPQAKPFE